MKNIIKLLFLMMLGKSIKLEIYDCIFDLYVSEININVNNGFNRDRVTITLRGKDELRIKE